MIAAFQQHLSSSVQRPLHAAAAVASLALDPNGRTLELDKRQSVALHDAVGWTVHSVSGAVWITQDWDTRDIVLEAGQSFVIDRPGAALISALDQARVCVARAPNRCAAAAARPVSSFTTNSPLAA